MKNKSTLIGVGVLVAVLLFGGVFFMVKGRSAEPVEEEEYTSEQELPKIDAKELGIEITPSADKKYVQFTMSNTKDITSIEWEFSYDADVPQIPGEEVEEGARVTQNFGGEAELDGKAFTSEKRELGTCSSGGKCRFDTGIETINLTVILTKSDGKKYQSEASTPLK